jgi:aminopeptidase N
MVQILHPITTLLCGLLAAAGTSVSAETEYRLPITVLPSHYTIRLVPYFEDRNFTFDGEVEITVNATTDASDITLHYDDMYIIGSPTVVSLAGFQELEVVNTTYDNVTDFFKMELSETLRRGQEYLIRIKYVGILIDGEVGFYRTSYNTSSNEKRYGLLYPVSRNGLALVLRVYSAFILSTVHPY